MATDIPALGRYLAAVDAELRSAVSTEQVVSAEIDTLREFYGWMHYHLGWTDEHFQPSNADGGKRLRPVFCLLACECLSGQYDPALPAAAAIELLHNFSLVHDDIEDGDRQRRHRPTLWTLVGIPHAINAGDALFALAQRELLQLGKRGVSPGRVLRASEIFQKSCVRLVEGQFLDLRAERELQSDLASYKQMVSGKTAALLGASTAVGAAVASDDLRQVQRFQDFGIELGLAFQMADDILGIWGDPAVTGKPAGADLRRKKKSLPVVLALAQGGELSAALRHAFAQAAPNDADVEHLMRLMDSAGIRQQAEHEAETHTQRAMQALQQIGATNAAGEMLSGLAGSLTRREK
jgi:geranylgeranyl diphosphate synthase, type I